MSSKEGLLSKEEFLRKEGPWNYKTKKRAVKAQRMEITEHVLYGKLARSAKEPRTRDALSRIAQQELAYYEMWRAGIGVEVEPNRNEARAYYWIAKVFGIVFMMKLRDFFIWRTYGPLEHVLPEAYQDFEPEMTNAQVLRSAIDDERLHYMGAIVMGLNDAIVEITGAIAGFALGLQNTTLIALAGLITGVAGALSMASSEFLEKQSESGHNPVKAAGYTGGMYFITALILVSSYLVLSDYLVALVVMLVLAFIIIVFFSLYSTFLFDQKLRSRLPPMLAMSFGVAFISFLIGSLLRVALHVSA